MHFKLLLFLSVIVFLASCGKDDSLEAGVKPQVTTTPVITVNSFSAEVGGNVVTMGGSELLDKGIVFGLDRAPTLGIDSVIKVGDRSLGAFTCTINGLNNNTIYRYRAYATNNGGTTYGDVQIFKTAFALGQPYLGGILFYLDKTNQHGLVSSTADQSIDGAWGCTGDSIAGADSMGIGKGQSNTGLIITNCTQSGIAAQLCSSFTGNNYNNWFLPSYAEIQLMYTYRLAIGGFTNNYYWTSSQYDANNAYGMDFTNGTLTLKNKSSKLSVRAIRAF